MENKEDNAVAEEDKEVVEDKEAAEENNVEEEPVNDNIIEDSRFISALECIKQRDYEGGCELLSKLIEKAVVKFGNGEFAYKDPRLGPLWYKYGTALLSKIENEGDIFEGGPKEVQVGEEKELEDSEIAWEALDTARIIYTKLVEENKSDEANLHLADVYLAIGDLSLELNNFEEAIGEYQSCLTIRQSLLQPYDRLISDAHTAKAAAYSYFSETSVERKGERTNAAKAYEQSRDVLKLYLQHLRESIPLGDDVDIKSMSHNDLFKLQFEKASDEQKKEIEKYEAILVDIDECVNDMLAPIEDISAEAPTVVTTIGFGTASTAPTLPSTTIPINTLPIKEKESNPFSNTNTISTTSSVAVSNSLQPRKKVKVVPVPVVVSENNSMSSNTVGVVEPSSILSVKRKSEEEVKGEVNEPLFKKIKE